MTDEEFKENIYTLKLQYLRKHLWILLVSYLINFFIILFREHDKLGLSTKIINTVSLLTLLGMLILSKRNIKIIKQTMFLMQLW